MPLCAWDSYCFAPTGLQSEGRVRIPTNWSHLCRVGTSTSRGHASHVKISFCAGSKRSSSSSWVTRLSKQDCPNAFDMICVLATPTTLS
eukprot:1859804-Rhodomonas_salina.7